MILRALLACLAAAAALSAGAQGMLENPAAGAASVSGVGLVSGWHCGAARVDIQIDALPPMAAATGTDRLDTLPACGRRDTGFGLLLNWAVLGPGTHTVRALADGVEFGRRTVTVVGLGAEFLTGKAASVTLGDFPAPGKSLVLEWQEGLQGFVARELRHDAPTLGGTWNGANLERRSHCANPQNDGARGTYAQYTITADPSGFFRIQQAGVTGLACTYTGTHSPGPAGRQVSGTFECADGKQGTFASTSVLVAAHALSMRLAIKLGGAESCDIDAIIGGSRY